MVVNEAITSAAAGQPKVAQPSARYVYLYFCSYDLLICLFIRITNTIFSGASMDHFLPPPSNLTQQGIQSSRKKIGSSPSLSMGLATAPPEHGFCSEPGYVRVR